MRARSGEAHRNWPDSEENFVLERLLSLRTRDSAAHEGLYALQMKSGAADWHTGEHLAFAT